MTMVYFLKCHYDWLASIDAAKYPCGSTRDVCKSYATLGMLGEVDGLNTQWAPARLAITTFPVRDAYTVCIITTNRHALRHSPEFIHVE